MFYVSENTMSNKYISILILSITLLHAAPDSLAEIMFNTEGDTWGGLRYPSSPEELEQDNLILEGAINQNFAVIPLSPSTRINFFLKLGYTFDEERIDYNNKLSLSPGFKLTHTFSNHGNISIGAMYQYEKRRVTDTDESGDVYFIDWWTSWSLECISCAEQDQNGPLGYPGSTWGNLRYPSALSEEEKDDLILEGAAEQGIDWSRTKLGTFNTFLDVAYKTDNKDIDWNNSVKLGIGLKLTKQIANNVSLSYGIKHVSERRWINEDIWNHDMTVFMSWWSGWSGL
ncbi:MAG: hypothetical protein DBP03_01040 [gamma proteobacterium symbiont of Ctena orbiculata]|nr:MAG: hypothetical protein DBP03_01040 [gamma proteobacterium symbiont of Ctena orbiculata]PUB79322.1 MAG: hypothetical protein DBO99_04195 [gamma proteobacterium symbiont of Ctena orbiculata]